MADEAASPQWLQDYQAPIDLHSSPSQSPDVSSSPERDFTKRKTVQLSDSEEDEVRQGASENAETENEKEVQDATDSLNHEDLQATAEEAVEETRKQDKRAKAKMTSSLPLIFPEKISRAKVLLECEGDALDVSGDVGAVGRVSVCETDKSKVFFDLKGTVYKTNIVESNSFFVVNIGPSEAKVEAIMNDFVQLVPDTDNRNVETMIEGTLEGMSFDTDDETAAPVETPKGETDLDQKGKPGKESKMLRKPAKPKDKAKTASKKPAKRSGAKAATNSKKASKKSK